MKTKNYKLNTLKCALGAAAVVLLCAAVPTSGAYTTDITQVQVNNPAQNAVAQINQILCVIGQTNYSYFVGKGPTLAMVDQNGCETGGNPGQQSNGSNASGVPNYLNIVFNAPTPSSGGPQTVQIWVTGSIGGGNGETMPVYIDATLSVTASPTTTNPYGLFNFEFTAYPQSNPSEIAMQGYIRSTLNASGQQQLSFVQTQSAGEKSQTNQVILIGNGTTDGYGLVVMPEQSGMSGNANQQFALSYDSNNVLQQVSTNGTNTSTTCFNRNDPLSVVYQYGIYNDDGSPLINPNSGYPVIYNGQQGFLNYYGLGLPNGTSPTNGSAVTYFTTGNVSHSGTMIVKGGKMSQLSTQSFTLGQLTGMQLSVPEPGGMGSTTNTSSIIEWSKSAQEFYKVATQSCDQSGCATTPLTTPTLFGENDFKQIAQVSGSGGGSNTVGTVNLWLNGLGGGGNTQLEVFTNCSFPTSPGQQPSCANGTYTTPSNSTTLTIWQNSLVLPSTTSGTTTYYCVSQCPYFSGGVLMFGQPSMDGSGGENPYITYSFDPVAYTLTGTSGSAIRESIISSSQPLMTGPLLTLAQYDNIIVGAGGLPNFAELYGGTAVSSYMQWQSGGSFNQYIGIADNNGTPLPLNAPIQLVYTNPTTGGSTFLQYSGVGNLQGIPGTCVNQNESPVGQNECNLPGNMWLPSYNIPSGSQVTDITGTNSYWVKQLFVSQIMLQNGSCGGLASNLTNATGLTLPTVSEMTPIPFESPPAVTKVSVINGVNQ